MTKDELKLRDSEDHNRELLRSLKGEQAMREQWSVWMRSYTPERFYDAFVEIAQGAESTCVNCGQNIYLDIVEGGGIPDWKTDDGDYGCNESPETTEDGTGGHVAKKFGD